MEQFDLFLMLILLSLSVFVKLLVQLGSFRSKSMLNLLNGLLVLGFLISKF